MVDMCISLAGFYHKDVFITNLLGVIFDQTGMV